MKKKYKRNQNKRSQKISQYILSWAKKIKAVKILGGKCEMCGEKHIAKLCFHHFDNKNKDEEIGNMLGGRWSLIESELVKCQLLCYNCHGELHDNLLDKNDNLIKMARMNKNILLNYKNQIKCQKCDYDKNLKCLDFHHINAKDKLFEISTFIRKMVCEDNIIPSNIKEELDKCIVVCKNCHKFEHFNVEKFNIYKPKILKKCNTMREQLIPINREEVKKLYESGIKQIDIAKKFNISKGGISEIIHSFGYGKSYKKINREKFLYYHNKGKIASEIANLLKCSTCSIYELYKVYNLKPNKPIIKNIKYIVKCVESGMSFMEIGKTLDLSRTAIRKRYNRYKSELK